MATKKSYCIIDDTKQTITFVADKLTKKEQETIKGLIAVGYKVNRTTVDKLYPAVYTKENVEKFLETKEKNVKEQFNKIQEELVKDKETGALILTKHGKTRKKGYVAALKWFKDTYKEEFLKFMNELEETKDKEETKEDKKK